MAPDDVMVFRFADLDKRRGGGFAVIHGLRAARVEAAAGGWIQWGRHVAGQQDAFTLHRGVRQGIGGQQGLRVGVLGVGEQGLGRRDFRQFSQIHHGDPVGDVPHDVEIMSNE